MSVPEQKRESINHVAKQLADEAQILADWAGEPNLSDADKAELGGMIDERNARRAPVAKELGQRTMEIVDLTNSDLQHRRELQDHNAR